MTTDPHEQFKGVKPVEERHKLDDAALTRWMADNVEGFQGPLTINQFKGGQSNPTYQLVTPKQKYVLRKKPGGKLLPSAHAVDREFRVMSALYPTGSPVARQYALDAVRKLRGTCASVSHETRPGDPGVADGRRDPRPQPRAAVPASPAGLGKATRATGCERSRCLATGRHPAGNAVARAAKHAYLLDGSLQQRLRIRGPSSQDIGVA